MAAAAMANVNLALNNAVANAQLTKYNLFLVKVQWKVVNNKCKHALINYSVIIS